MPRVKKKTADGISEKLEYLNLDLENVPKSLIEFEPLQYRMQRISDEKQYRQYRYVPIDKIQILISQTNRLDDFKEKYRKARPLAEYLDYQNEENLLKYTTFLNMLKSVNIKDIEKVEEEQEKLNKKIPLKIKYQGNYLWQIYYSENTDKYFMIVTTEDTDYSTFFYLLKKKIEKNKNEEIFVPISNIQYSSEYLKRKEFADLENYLWLFTKDWPLIYEVHNKNNNLSIQIIGETNVYEKIKTSYKVELKNKEQSNYFYKLLKALFILQTELPHYYNFRTNIDDNGELKFYFENQEIVYENLAKFIREQYKNGIKRKREIKIQIRKYTKKLEQLKQSVSLKEIEYLAKEKQISTFLECKKSFFGKVKYYFKYSKKNKRVENIEQEENDDLQNVRNSEKIVRSAEKDKQNSKKKIPIKKIYTLDELITSYKELEELETKMKNILLDVNALKLKNKNMQKKIENATKFIEEIDSHKKSIFEFWKYSNKDEIAALPEGEEEEVNIIKKIEKTFDYEEDIEEFGKNLDMIQRKNLSKTDADSIFIATTNILEILNKIKTNKIMPKELEKNLKEIKDEEIQQKDLNEEEYDIFGKVIEDSRKVNKINNKRHRELPRDKFEILEVNQNTKKIGYRLTLELVIKNIMKSLNKVVIPESLSVYQAIPDEKLDEKEINVFNINPEKEIESKLKTNFDTINLYKINVKQGVKGIGFTNIIFYNNQNKTLPIGMDLSTKMILDISKLNLKLKSRMTFKMMEFENDEDDFSEFSTKNVNVYEYDISDEEKVMKVGKRTNNESN